MEHEESTLAALDRIREAVHEQFPDAGDRLAQLDAHVATCAMVIGHIHDEAARTAEGN